MKYLSAAVLVMAACTARAEQPSQPDALAWLQKCALASHQLTYYGVFFHQRENHVETSRVTHVTDSSGESEKLEALDGPPRIFIGNGEQITCYLPESKTIKIEKPANRKFFPALLPVNPSSLLESYRIKKGGTDRVAGYDCQVIVLEPKDSYRYGHRLCVEVNSGLLLQAGMLSDKDQLVDQIAFAQLSIGGSVDKEALKPRFPDKAPDWRYDNSPPPEAGAVDIGWVIKSQPLGYKIVMEMKRMFKGKPAPISHIVLSDGLSAVSVFVEDMPANSKVPQALVQQGGITVYTRPLADHVVTVLGEAPAATLIQIGDSVAAKPK